MLSLSGIDRDVTRAVARSLAAVSGVIAGYVAAWSFLDSGYLLAIFGTYAALGGLLLWQVVRATGMATWRRRIAAVLSVPALSGTVFAGLRPRPACLDAPGCGEGLTLQPLWFGLFAAVTVALVAVDYYSD